MKHIIFILLIIVLNVVGCSSNKKGEKQQEISMKNINDSAVLLIQKGEIYGDTTKIRTAIQLLDVALSADTITSNRYLYFCNKAIAYNLIGDSIGAEREWELAISQLPPNHIDRLMYWGEKYHKIRLNDSASYYLSLAMQKCNMELAEKISLNLIVKKCQILILQDKKSQALNYLRQMDKEIPNNDVIHALILELDSDKTLLNK